nr:hypothetical protein [Tanacetum cinerariifolium]
MAITIDQQTALDESLVPSKQRLRIGEAIFDYPRIFKAKKLLFKLSMTSYGILLYS